MGFLMRQTGLPSSVLARIRNSWFRFKPRDEIMIVTTESKMDRKMQSEWIVCVQCDREFEYEISEQARHAEMGYDTPRRCPDCRKHKTRILSGWERKMNKSRQKKNQRRDEDDGRRRTCRI